jgi:hypothetical protein
LLAGLHCFRRHDGDILQRVQSQRDVDQLARPKDALLVIESSFQANGSGGVVDGVVDDGKKPASDFVRVLLQRNLHRKLAIAAVLADVAQVLFGHAEADEDGFNLIDDN